MNKINDYRRPNKNVIMHYLKNYLILLNFHYRCYGYRKNVTDTVYLCQLQQKTKVTSVQ